MTPATSLSSSAFLRRTAILLSTLLVAFMLAGCGFGRSVTTLPTIRVMTWNIHHGEGTDKNVDLHRIAQLILDENVDIVALQEIDRGVGRTKKIDIITSLADMTGMTYAFGKTIDFQGGDYGNAILTKFPIFEERNVLFSKIGDAEQRGVLLLVVGIGGEEIVIANTHLDSQGDDSVRVANVAELKSVLKGYSPRPVVVCGDFNDIPSSRVVTQLKEEYLDAWESAGTWEGFTFPSDVPAKREDYIFTNNKRRPDSAAAAIRLRPLSAHVTQSTASDHLPLLVQFEFSTER